MLEAMTSWRLTMDAIARARPCGPDAGATRREVPIALDLRFDALTPGIGTDGQAGAGPRSDVARATSGTVGKGHFEQAGRWSGSVVVDGQRLEWGAAARGNRDRSWGPRRWGGPRMWRWFSINVDDDLHFGGIRLGTDAGDLHRGWVWADGRATSVAAWRIRTELADDALTHRVVHLEVEDKRGHHHSLRADVLRVAALGGPGDTLVNEGLARWTLLGTEGSERAGYGICEYLHQLDDAGRPVVPVE
ncbi:MAG TPA: hypothetical protein VKT18_08170, partial [Acidimicrobiales bacterium]|nr:hypothetical protein [Acidimicrobiales bacterium]